VFSGNAGAEGKTGAEEKTRAEREPGSGRKYDRLTQVYGRKILTKK